jgi:hypothetical protein
MSSVVTAATPVMSATIVTAMMARMTVARPAVAARAGLTPLRLACRANDGDHGKDDGDRHGDLEKSQFSLLVRPARHHCSWGAIA